MAKKRQKGFLTAFSIIFILIFALGILTPKVQYMIVKALSKKDKAQNEQQ